MKWRLNKKRATMSTDPKKYYWLKLFDSFFRDPKIKKLKTLAGGDTYIVILLKFMLYTIKNNGIYVFEGIEKTLEKELELVLDEKEEHINVVLMFLQQTGLILEVAENQFQLTQVPTMLGTESTSAERVRKHRATKQKALQCNTTVTRCNIEIEKNKKEMEKWEVISEKMALRQIRKDIEIEKLENLAQEEKEIII
ncbi:MAG: phage replisome organizer N-terminal domain-containing protein [Arcobacteraceae bacterium]